MNELKQHYSTADKARTEFHKVLKIRLVMAEKKREELDEYLADQMELSVSTAKIQLTACSFKKHEKALELIEEFFKEN